MSNAWDDMNAAINDARSKISAADGVVSSMARMIAGRLRKAEVSRSVLTALKKELADYNMHTGKWKRK